MKCFEHHHEEAQAVCRVCGKGLCGACAETQPYAVTCHGACAQRATLYNRINDNAKNTYALQKRFRYLGPVFFLLMGLIFLGSGLTGANKWNFTTTAGCLFTLFGLALLLSTVLWNKKIR